MTDTITILVVDDDDDTRQSVAEALLEKGYAVLCASNGWEALRLLKEGPRVSVILLDLMMPPLNGWQFRAEQLKDAALAQIPVIIMTAAAPYWGVPEGVGAHLKKPFDLADLFRAIDRVAA